MENEEYTPEKPVYYNYGLKNFLVKDVNEFDDLNNYNQILLCVYKVNKDGKFPFLEYLLTNNGYDILSLPRLPIFATFSKENLLSYSNVFLSGILQSENFEDFSNSIEFDGFYEFNSELYLFFDVTNSKIGIDETYSSSNLRFGLIDEIINHKCICNIKISPEVTNFFLQNESINYLLNEHLECYETPVAGYVGKQMENKLKFISMFGESARDKLALLGPYYYFTNFNNALRQTGDKGGIVRFALFTGCTKYIENFPNDNIDESEIKKELINSEDNDNKKNRLTLRISDHDGLWSENYDSAYIGELELDDGSFLDDTPILVLKDYKQQIPLGYHFIHKNKSGIV